ncbi:periplasmic protein TonB [Gammaproteobacteria bacterium]
MVLGPYRAKLFFHPVPSVLNTNGSGPQLIALFIALGLHTALLLGVGILVAKPVILTTPLSTLQVVAFHRRSPGADTIKAGAPKEYNLKKPSPSESLPTVPVPLLQSPPIIRKSQQSAPPIYPTPSPSSASPNAKRRFKPHLAKHFPPKFSNNTRPVRNTRAPSNDKSVVLPAPNNELAALGQQTGTAISPSLAEEPSNPVAYRNNPPPVYPLTARNRGIEGTVLLAVVVDVSGLPIQVEIRKSSGTLILDDAARKAVQHWRFEPARRAGQTLIATVEVPIRFYLVDP